MKLEKVKNLFNENRKKFIIGIIALILLIILFSRSASAQDLGGVYFNPNLTGTGLFVQQVFNGEESLAAFALFTFEQQTLSDEEVRAEHVWYTSGWISVSEFTSLIPTQIKMVKSSAVPSYPFPNEEGKLIESAETFLVDVLFGPGISPLPSPAPYLPTSVFISSPFFGFNFTQRVDSNHPEAEGYLALP